MTGGGRQTRVREAAGFMAGLIGENGWPCAGDLGAFRGPSRADAGDAEV